MADCSVVFGTAPVVPESVLLDSLYARTFDRPTYENTILIFDWDDTLLASSWIASQGCRLDAPVPKEAVGQLKVLETAVVNLLSKALLFGEVHLVTNAQTGWVELSAQKFMPKVASLLPHVTVISARSGFEEQYPGSPEKWKVEAFRLKIKEGFENRMEIGSKMRGSLFARNIISFGDSLHERTALKQATANMDKTYCKSVKFVEFPTCEQLERQVRIVANSLDYLCSHAGNLDLMLVVEMLYD